jgi:putative tricarboxylic transport membrane protein
MAEQGGGHHMKRVHLYITLFWIAFGIFFSVCSYRLGLGEFLEPGPGLFSFGIGLIIMLLGVYKLISAFLSLGKGERGLGEKEEGSIFSNTSRLAVLAVVLFAYALFLQRLGYLISTFLGMALLLRIAGYARWVLIIVYAAIISVISYAGFSYLGVIFPHGILDLGFLFLH